MWDEIILKTINTLIEDGTCRYVYVYFNYNNYVVIHLKITKNSAVQNTQTESISHNVLDLFWHMT